MGLGAFSYEVLGAAFLFAFELIFFLTILLGYIITTLNRFTEGDINFLQLFFRVLLCTIFLICIFSKATPIAIIVFIIGAGEFLFVYYKNKSDETTNIDKIYLDKINEYEKVVEEHPEDWGTLSEIAHNYFKAKSYHKAIEIQKEVIKRSSDDFTERKKLEGYLLYLKQVDRPYKFCWFCGTRLSENSDICKKCGKDCNGIREIKTWLINGGIKEIAISMSYVLIVVIIFFFILKVFSPDMISMIFFWIAMVGLGVILKIVFKQNE